MIILAQAHFIKLACTMYKLRFSFNHYGEIFHQPATDNMS